MLKDEFTIDEKMLSVGSGHKLYCQLWGNPKAPKTVIFLHGGPGSGCSDAAKTQFNPLTHKVIFFDQRGSGKSTPAGSLLDNDTDHMVEDINQVADAFKINSFILTGGSWGSCLALVYGIRYPERVERMVLRGIFTGRESENDFLDKGYFKDFFPEVWEKFVLSVPTKFRAEPGKYHQRVITDSKSTQKEIKKSAYAYAVMESSLVSIDDRHTPDPYEEFDPNSMIVECTYLARGCFLPENYVFKNASKLTMPIDLVQGRYDSVCPPVTAYELAKVLPKASLHWTSAGHSGRDRSNWETTKSLLSVLAV